MSEDVLKSLVTTRPATCPSEFALTQFDLQALPDSEQSAIGAHVAGCDTCRGFLDDMHAAFSAIPKDVRNEIVAASHRASAEATEPVRSSRRWWAPVVGVLAAAGALVAVFPSPPEDPFQSKGMSGLRVYRERSGEVSALAPNSQVSAGDRLRFEVSLDAPGYVAIIGVESDGSTYPCFPAAGGAATRRPRGSGQLLPGAIALDASTGRESLYLVVCAEPFETDLDPGRAAEMGCQTERFDLDKRGGS